MKRIFTLLFILCSLQLSYAQLSSEDVAFWVGTGSQEAYFLVDFRDGTEDASFGWGVRFDSGQNVSMLDALDMIAAADAGFSTRTTSGFLNDVIYNHHQGLDGDPDWWSTWSGVSVDLLGMQGGLSEQLVDGKWYGISYGFMSGVAAPTFKYAAYDPTWFSLEDVAYWIGEGEEEAAITIDFVSSDDGEEEVTYVWGVKFDDSITGVDALEMLADAEEDLEIVFDADGEIESIQYKDLEASIDATNHWKAFIGNSMSDYQPTVLSEEITANKIFGVSFGDANVRRPFIPTAVEEPEIPVEEPEFENLGEEDVVFWVGTGSQEAYFLVDFRDGTEDVSFGWGVRFDSGQNVSMLDALDMIAAADAGFSTRTTGGFLNDVIYNHHQGLDGDPDWWSTWSGVSVDLLGMQGGLSEQLIDGKWYGISYGFTPFPAAPTFKYAAYDPAWFSLEDVAYWIGEGEGEAAITIDFVSSDDEEEVTYVWGVKFDDSITGVDALEMLADAEEDLEIVFDADGEIESIQYKDLEASIDATNHWKAFIGNSMSDYQPTVLSEEITANKIFGVSFGDANVRRPFIPTAVEDPNLGVVENTKVNLKIWPNPVAHTLYVESENAIENIRVFTLIGTKVLETSSSRVEVNSLSSGIYLIEITGAEFTEIKRFVKK